MVVLSSQRYVPVPIAVRLTLGLAQVNVAELGLMLRIGAFWSALTTTLAEAVQPLVAANVTEYVPAALTGRIALVVLSSQRSVPVPTAVRLILGVAQVNVAELGVMLTEAGVVF